MTNVQVLDLSQKKRMIACLMDIHDSCNNVSNGSLQEGNALLSKKSDLQSIHWATAKMTTKPLLVVRKHADAIVRVQSKQFIHLGMLSYGDQHQWRVQRDRHESVRGHTMHMFFVSNGNHTHTGGETPQCFTK